MHRDFTYKISKDGRVHISWQGKPVVVLKGNKASKFLSQCEGKTGDDLQLVLCRFTGNFKRGNERQ
ncbi:MAG: hypothetical protein HKN21_11870 [Candidatus Eisenbacteria bacterium]|uniref:Uncharacterized protein n=1 Tax=Eiseniibacteriota bacterium TaxID=2212470 RepID=A0A7Y2E925_UNCEI|nr:hypothetical protein [Candidatus Eisenbacteria bacterium]